MGVASRAGRAAAGRPHAQGARARLATRLVCPGGPMDDSRRRLLWHGMFLFLLGLITGFVETQFANTRMGLAAHLEGVMNGTFLVPLGAIWAHVKLSPGLKRTAFWGALYGTYANWTVTTLAAVFGTGALSP